MVSNLGMNRLVTIRREQFSIMKKKYKCTIAFLVECPIFQTNYSFQVLGDIAMSLADPHATNFLVSSALKIIQYLINNESLPRVSSDIKFK